MSGTPSQTRKRKTTQADGRMWATMTEVGHLFGLSGLQVGKQLKALGWRHENGAPTQQALDSGMARQTTTSIAFGTRRSVERVEVTWRREMLHTIFTASGLQAIGDPGDEMFSLAARINALLVQAQRRNKDGDGDKADWLVSSASQRIRRRLMGLLRPQRKEELATRLLVLLTGSFGHSQQLAESLMVEAGIPVEPLRRRLLMKQAGEPMVGHPGLEKRRM